MERTEGPGLVVGVLEVGGQFVVGESPFEVFRVSVEQDGDVVVRVIAVKVVADEREPAHVVDLEHSLHGDQTSDQGRRGVGPERFFGRAVTLAKDRGEHLSIAVEERTGKVE